MKTLKGIWIWLVLSSKDPNKLALTVRGFLVGALPVILILTKYFGLEVAQDDVLSLVELIVKFIIDGFAIVGTVMTGWGLIRKLTITAKKVEQGEKVL